MLEDRNSWVDPIRPETAETLRKLILHLPGDIYGYFLIDAAFVPGLAQWLADRCGAGQSCSIYQGRYRGDGIEAVAPYLVRLPQPLDEREALFEQLMRLVWGKPVLNVLFSRLPLPELATQLQRQLEAVDPNGNAFVLRLADTRSLTALFAVMHTGQRQRMLRHIRRWICVDRRGNLQSLNAHGPKSVESTDNTPIEDTSWPATDLEQPPEETPYVFDAEQAQRLDRLALPDAILRFAQLRESAIGTLTISPSAAHAAIEEAAQRLARRGVLEEAAAYRSALNLLRRRGCLAQSSAKLSHGMPATTPQHDQPEGERH